MPVQVGSVRISQNDTRDDAQSGLTRSAAMWDIPIMAQRVIIAKHDKRKRLVLPDDFVAEAPYGEYIIREGKGHLSIIAIPPPKTKRIYTATAALEKKLREAKGSKELDCPPDFFTEPLNEWELLSPNLHGRTGEIFVAISRVNFGRAVEMAIAAEVRAARIAIGENPGRGHRIESAVFRTYAYRC